MLQSFEIPNMNWEVINMHYIFGLTTSTHGDDAIFVCVDKLFKIICFMPTTTQVIAKGMARLFRDHVFKLHGLSKVILSNTDARFTSKFWNAFYDILGTWLAMSATFRLQTNGHMERINHIIEDMLQPYVNPAQDDQDKFHFVVEFS